MKKLMFFVATGMLAATAYGQNDIMKVKVSIDGEFDGKKALLLNMSSNQKVDSCQIKDGKFEFKVNESESPAFRILVERNSEILIFEKGEVEVKFDPKGSTVVGSKLNSVYQGFDGELRNARSIMNESYAKLKEANDKEGMAKLIEDYYKTIDGIYSKYFDANITNGVGVLILVDKLNGGDYNLAQVDSLINIVGDKARDFGAIKSIREAKVNYENTKEGKMFADFDGLNPDGTPAKLSDYVGKGKYVLVDFWASWCGPCRAEVPHLKEIYELYKDKDFVLLGANVWDKKAPFEKAVVDLDMPWAQICNFDTQTPTQLYGINGIPHIILFAPDGTVKYRNLRGEDMKAKLAAIFSK